MANISKEEAIAKVAEKTGMIVPKNYSDQVLNTINKYQDEQGLVLPKNYSPSNALKIAWLKISEIKDKNNNLVLQSCSQESIANAMLQMVILGLNPAKDQCYFVPFGNQLQIMTSYFGKITVLNRIEGFDSISAEPIYEGDEISYDIDTTGRKYNLKHKQSFENIDDNKIIGGYCVIVFEGVEYAQVRTYKQIQEAWGMSKMSKDKTKFRSEFVKRTMINTSIKWFTNTSDDKDLLISTLKDTSNNEFDFNESKEKETEYHEPKIIIQEEDTVKDINEL